MEKLFSLDYILYILPIRSDGLTLIMKGFSFLGDEEFFLIFFPVSYWLWNKSILARTGVIMFFSIFFNAWIKNFFEIPRPFIESVMPLETVDVNDWSFPSGHAHYSTVVWGWMAYELKKLTATVSGKVDKTARLDLPKPRLWQKSCYPIAMGIILAIGFSRIYLGVHYPIDVIAGFLLGYLTLVGYYYLTQTESKKWNSLPVTIQSIILFLCIMILFLIPHALTEAEVKGAAVFLGFAIGVICEKKYLNFEYHWNQNHLSKLKFILKSIMGSIGLGYLGLLIIWIGLKHFFLIIHLLPDLGDFIRYLLLGLWVGFLAPYVFCRLGLALGTSRVMR